MKMPATTMVAAWISADTGVGPAMASGSQVWRMNWPDFDDHRAEQGSSSPPASAGGRCRRCRRQTPLANSLISTMSKRLAAQ